MPRDPGTGQELQVVRAARKTQTSASGSGLDTAVTPVYGESGGFAERVYVEGRDVLAEWILKKAQQRTSGLAHA